MAYKRLSQSEWNDVESEAMGGASNMDLSRKYGISEGAIRKRLGSVRTMKVERAAKSIVAMRAELETLPPGLQIRAYCVADALTEISKSMTYAALAGAKTSEKLTAIANNHAMLLDEYEPDPDKLRMIHGLTETANKAAYQPVELLKAVKGSIAPDVTVDPVATVDPAKVSSAAIHELIAARRSAELSR